MKLRPTAGDCVLLLVLLAGSLTPWMAGGSSRAGTLVIRHPGGIHRYSLDHDRTIRLTGSMGPFVIRIRRGMAEVMETHCPHRICRRMSPLKRAGEVLVCVPQRIEVSVEGTQQGVDAVCH